MEQMNTVPARFWPRSGSDAFISMSLGLLQVAILFILPSILIALLLQNILIGIGAYFALLFFWTLFSVRMLRVSENGMEFVRVFGSPKQLSWNEITSVEKAARSETIVHGWLWPPFPTREMTFSLTSLGHYRISYGSKWVYYPPKDSEEFESLVKSFLPRS